MIYPSADKLNKIGSKYKLIAMAATRAKQLKSGMKPLIPTDSKNYLTIAFEEIAAGVITANIEDVDELATIDYSEMQRTTATYDVFQEENSKYDDDDAIDELDKEVEKRMTNMPLEHIDKAEIAESMKAEATNLDDIKPTELNDDEEILSTDLNTETEE